MLTVTALCLTRNRREWLPRAIESFLQQTYKEKKMLILADGDTIHDLVPRGIIFAHCREPWAPNIGAKRNIGCEMATSDLIATWDDDDLSAPGRLTDQIERLESSKKAVTGYSHLKFTNGQNWWKYMGHPFYAIGTSLLFRRDWWIDHPFPSVHIGEDTDFSCRAHAAGQLTAVDGTADLLPRFGPGDMMLANMHPGNSSKKIPGSNWMPL